MDVYVIKFKCVVCGKLTAGRMPRAGRHVGDTTARFPRRHKANGTQCPGVWQEAEWVSIQVVEKLIKAGQTGNGDE